MLELPILKDLGEELEAFGRQKPHGADEAGDAAGRKGAAGEAEQHDLVPVVVVETHEAVRFTDVVRESLAGHSANVLVVQRLGAGAHAINVADDLVDWLGGRDVLVQARCRYRTCDACYIAGYLIVTVAVHPGSIAADDDAFLRHSRLWIGRACHCGEQLIQSRIPALPQR